MNKKLYLILVAIAVLAIGGYFYPSVTKIIEKQLGVSSVVGVGGPPTGINELRFADEVDVGFRKLQFETGSTTLTYDNFDKVRIITGLSAQWTSNATDSLSTFWVLMATSSATSTNPAEGTGSLTHPFGGLETTAVVTRPDIWAVQFATSSRATSSPFMHFRQTQKVDTPEELNIVIQPDERLFFSIYHESRLGAWAGHSAGTGFECGREFGNSVSCHFNATSTQNPVEDNIDIVIEYHD